MATDGEIQAEIAEVSEMESTERNETRARRRQVIKGAVAMAGGVAAASYVTPSLRKLGIPAALAASGGTTVIEKCSIDVSIPSSSVSCTKDITNNTETISGTIEVKNNSGTGVCPVASVDVYLQSGNSPYGGGCGQDTTTNQVGHASGNTGGSNPIVTGTDLPSPDTSDWTFSVSTTNYIGPVFITVEIVLTDQPQHNPGFFFKYCANATC